MDKIKRFFECLLPVSVCNLECEYCYIIQESRRNMELAQLKYTPEQITRALRKERLGGTCFISICGAGETLAQKESVEITARLLKEGHYVNITTNGTLSTRFDEIIQTCGQDIRRLHISFSLHYIELKTRGWLERFFKNVQKMRDAGASILVQMNLCDSYMPYFDEIQQVATKYIGALPQLALTRNENTHPIQIYTSKSKEEYIQQGNKYQSPLFDFTTKNFGVKRREFCYAGEWSGVLDLSSGVLRKCYSSPDGVDIFANPNSPIHFEPIGKNCQHEYCINSSHFMSLGIIPSIKTPSYSQLRNRPQARWQTPEMQQFLNSRLWESNRQYTRREMCSLERKLRITKMKQKLAKRKWYQFLHKLKERLK